LDTKHKKTEDLMPDFPLDIIKPYSDRLNNHEIYGALASRADLAVFMEHHVYSVWDFMSMIKYLQGQIAPARYPWVPKGDPLVRRFINELVLEEESDQGLPDEAGGSGLPAFMSHFELYCHAMRAIGADVRSIQAFVTAAEQGIDAALNLECAPAPSARFTKQTFLFLQSGQAHVVASAFAMGREHIIPGMFRACLADMDISAKDAAAFHYYLNRHVHLDQDFHGPLSLRMLNHFIGDSAQRRDEAVTAAIAAIEARISFWDGVLAAIRG